MPFTVEYAVLPGWKTSIKLKHMAAFSDALGPRAISGATTPDLEPATAAPTFVNGPLGPAELT